MRAVFIALILMNVGYFGYRQYVFQTKEFVAIGLKSDVDPIYLLRENSVGALRNKEMDLAVKNPVVPVVGVAANCQAVGPFPDVFMGQDVADQLAALGIAVALKAVDSKMAENDYRVMIPPAVSLQDAFRKLSELKSQEIDSYVITKGNDALGISLGVFSSKKSALLRQAELGRAGYEAVVVPLSRVTREFWLFGAEPAGFDLDGSVWSSLEENYPGISFEAQQCQET